MRCARRTSMRPSAPRTVARPKRWCAWPREEPRRRRLREIPVKRIGNRTILVRDVAQVVDGVEEATSVAFVNERPAIALDVQKQAGANTVGVADGVRAAVERMQPELPPGVSLQMVRDNSVMIKQSVDDVQLHELLLGALLTVLVVMLFLNDWKATTITALALPVSVVSSFVLMSALGFTLNVLTLMALSLSIGILIDDAIVVVENIVRHRGERRRSLHSRIARKNVRVGLAVMATTLSIVAVFVPVAFMGGIIGRFFFQFGLTVAWAVLVSLFVSSSRLTPMLSSRWYDPDVEEDRKRGPRRPDTAGVQPAVRQPARIVRTHARLVAAAPLGRVGRRASGICQRVSDPRGAGRRFHARLQPR